MRLKADLRNLIDNQPTTILTSACAVGATALTVGNTTGFIDDDFLLIGKLGEGKAEIVQISSTPATATALAVSATLFDHDEDTPITRLDWNQVRFYYGATSVSSASAALAAAVDIDPSDIYQYYEDASNSTGYGFVRFYNETTTGYSEYSDAIPYTGYTKFMLRMMRDKVRRLLNETDELNSEITNDDIDEEIGSAQTEIAHDRLWSFYENVRSFSTVADQYKYDLATDVYVLFDATFDTQPLVPITMHKFNLLRWDTDTTSDPTHMAMWRKCAYLFPYPTASADATTLGAAIVTTTATTITVVSTSGFDAQGRFKVDSEVISYTGLTATTFTGCVRGEEGTTAATHLIAAAVTKRDVIYYAQEEPSDLVNETDSTQISEPAVVTYKAGAELALNLDKPALHDRLLAKYMNAMTQLRKVDEPKFKKAFGRVQPATNTDVHDPNLHPTNIS